jgi:tyrosinase
VYLGLQPGDDARPDDTDRYAGLLTLFGVYEASRDDGSSAADGQSRRLDVTAQVREQAATLRPLAVRIRLTPVNPDRDLSGARLSVGRIVLEFT